VLTKANGCINTMVGHDRRTGNFLRRSNIISHKLK